MRREPICGVDYKLCAGCGDDMPIASFIHDNYETPYCEACRTPCIICTDWVGACGGCEEAELLPRRVA